MARFTDDTENRYFRYYIEQTAFQIQGPFRTQIWNRLIPQAGELQPYIRQAIVAIGALSKSYAETELPSPSSLHQMFALKAYGRALKGMREEVQTMPNNFTLIIAALLMFSFESMQGHQAAANMHAVSLVSLLHHRSKDIEQPLRPALYLSPQQAKTNEAMDLLSAFSGLDLQALCLDNRSAAVHRELKDGLNNVLAVMPEEFESLAECRVYLDLIWRRNYHFVSVARAELTSTESTESTEPGYMGICVMEEISEAARRYSVRDTSSPSGSVGLSSKFDIPAPLLAEQARYIDDIHHWEHLASPILAQPACHPPSPGREASEDFLQAVLLQIHASCNIVLLARTFFPPEMAYDAYLPEYQKQVRLCELIAPFMTSSAQPYRFDLGIVTALSQTSTLCRHSATRGRALALMKACGSYTEGIWSCRQMYVIDSFVRDVEEADDGVGADGWVRGDRRVTLKAMDISVNERTAKVLVKREYDGREILGDLRHY